MKRLVLAAGVFTVAALVSQTAQAEVRVRAGTGSSTYTLGGDYISAKSTYTPTTLGVTYAADNGFYVDLAYSGGTGKHDGWTGLGAPKEDFKRSDVALIAGASMLNRDTGNSATLYAGLKTGKTTLGAPRPPLAWSEETFTTTGFVFGGGGSFPIAQGRGGSFGVNAGLGIMGATWKDNDADFGGPGFDVKSKTAVGFSFGLSYTYPFTSNFGVTADYKYNSYSYTFGDTTNPFKVDEKISALGASLYAKF